MEMLEKPSAQELMQIVAVCGLAQNFAALRSLTTTGIQEGHMKMHLGNIMSQFHATKEERHEIRNHFHSRPVSHAAVVDYIASLRKDKA
jgi:hydroxymethylglutaryl-CoA reductase